MATKYICCNQTIHIICLLQTLAASLISPDSASTALNNLLGSIGVASQKIPVVNLTMIEVLAQIEAAAQTGQIPFLNITTAKISALKVGQQMLH